ncbi:MAG: helix-turn-helix domain-containing protein [Castellaniella sp.]|uniref:helix-turn-helix domain-containing protein n=1 Tax=Castellaniella sp. TaxID=1955812 RepID=UPI003A899B99
MSTTTPLEHAVREQLERYFEDLGDATPHDMLSMVGLCVERTVLEVALERTGGNQTRAADMLGITRGTLRKKLQAHQIQA